MPALAAGRTDGAWRRPLGALAVVLAMLAGPFLVLVVSGPPPVPLLTESDLAPIVRDLPCPSGTQAIQQLSGRIPVAQYAGTGNERYAAALRDVFIDGVHVKSCRAPRPTGKWQTAYHVAVIRGESYQPEYGTRALSGVINLHKARLENAQETRLESPGGPSAPEVQAVAVIGRFTRPSGDVDNIHLYHFVHGNAVAWILFQAVSPSLPLTTVPDPESWRVFQEMYVRLRGVAPPPPVLGLQFTQCELDMFDFHGQNGPVVFDSWLGGNGLDGNVLRRRDLRDWNTGRIVSDQDYAKGLDVKKLTLSVTPLIGLRITYHFVKLPPQLPGAALWVVADLPNVSSGFRTAYTDDLEWDRGIVMRWGGPGRWDVLGGEYTRERPIAGAAVQELPDRVTVTIPVRAVEEIGLAAPGVRAVFGSVSPMPDRVYDRIPEVGAIQIGFSAQVSWRDLLKVDTNSDRRDDFAFGTTSGESVQGVAFDGNLNGRTDFLLGEGPFLFRVGTGYMDFSRPSRTDQGRVVILRSASPNLTVAIRAEDRNGDGDLTDEEEARAAFVPQGTTGYWKF